MNSKVEVELGCNSIRKQFLSGSAGRCQSHHLSQHGKRDGIHTVVLPSGDVKVPPQHPTSCNVAGAAAGERDGGGHDDRSEGDLVPWPFIQSTVVPGWVRGS